MRLSVRMLAPFHLVGSQMGTKRPGLQTRSGPGTTRLRHASGPYVGQILAPAAEMRAIFAGRRLGA